MTSSLSSSVGCSHNPFLAPPSSTKTMGSCISKCCHGPSAPIHPNQPSDKLVISQSTAQPASNYSSTTSFSLDSSTRNYYSSSYSSETKLYSNESMSSTTESKKIVILDPQKASNPIPGPKQRLQTAAIRKQLPTKRERSASPPPCARQKIFRCEPKLRSASPPACQELNYLPPTRRRMKMVPPSNLVKDPLMIVNYLKETVRPPNSGNTSKRLAKGHVMRRGHLVHPEQSKCGRMEDIDNPLISMECFIFL